MRFRHQESNDDVRVELTSMTDIVFLLLIFFMLSSTFVDLGRHLNIQLPETRAGDVTQEVQRHIIEMGAQDVLQLDGQAVTLQDLSQRLQQSGTTGQLRSVIIRADKRLPYGMVMTVLGLVRQANIQDIAVAVR